MAPPVPVFDTHFTEGESTQQTRCLKRYEMMKSLASSLEEGVSEHLFSSIFDCDAASSSIWVYTDCRHKLSHMNKQAEVSARAGAGNINQDELWLAGIFSI